MKKILFAFLGLWLILTLLPACIGISFGRDPGKEKSEKELQKSALEIKYLDKETGKIHKIDIEDYLVGVLAAEMPAEYHIEALKAQAVAARSFVLKRKEGEFHEGADVCTDPEHCKGYISEREAKKAWEKSKADKYWGKLEKAVDDTRGEHMTSEGEVLEAFFFARSGGRTENSEDVWGEKRAYLRSVESEADKKHPEFLSVAEVANKDARKLLGDGAMCKKGALKIGEITYTEGGNVNTIELEGKKYKGSEIRKIFGLKSSDFDVSAGENSLVFEVRGYGHGVGMSQFGANEMAKSGKKYTEILSHYYTNIQIVKK